MNTREYSRAMLFVEAMLFFAATSSFCYAADYEGTWEGEVTSDVCMPGTVSFTVKGKSLTALTVKLDKTMCMQCGFGTGPFIMEIECAEKPRRILGNTFSMRPFKNELRGFWSYTVQFKGWFPSDSEAKGTGQIQLNCSLGGRHRPGAYSVNNLTWKAKKQ